MSRPATTLALFALLLAACNAPTAPSLTPSPYNPFVSLDGSTPAISKPDSTPSGPTPTLAPLHVPLPPPGASLTTPTPDAPHPLPTPRQEGEEYTVQAGDTLGTISQRYGVSVEAVMQANGLTNPDLLAVGQVLTIPTPEPGPPGPARKIIPDSELVYGPASALFDVEAFIRRHGGYLSDYTQEINGEVLTAAEIVTRIAQNYSINPRLLLAILEYRSAWVTSPSPNPETLEYPLGYYDPYRPGLYHQLAWAANELNRGYYLWRANAVATWVLGDGSVVPIDPTINAGTAALQYFFGLLQDRAAWEYDLSAEGFIQTYQALFGNPFDLAIEPLLPPDLSQPPMILPFERGVTWSFTGGPHGGWDTGSAWAALDFAPPGETAGCGVSPEWVTAMASGWIVRTGDGAVIQDLSGDGYEQTGWVVLYMHVAAQERVEAGQYLWVGERIGHPSCEGGLATGTHVHIARRYDGEWIAADGPIPFVLDGWVSGGMGVEYDGTLTRGGQVIEAWEGKNERNQIRR